MLQKTCRDYTEKELIPIAGALDKAGQFPAQQVSSLSWFIGTKQMSFRSRASPVEYVLE